MKRNGTPPLVSLGQGEFTRHYDPELKRQIDDTHGPIHERLSEAHHNAAMCSEYLDEIAEGLHPDFRMFFWSRLRDHITTRLLCPTEHDAEAGE